MQLKFTVWGKKPNKNNYHKRKKKSNRVDTYHVHVMPNACEREVSQPIKLNQDLGTTGVRCHKFATRQARREREREREGKKVLKMKENWEEGNLAVVAVT